VVNSHSVFV
jgi:hypothetical protein